MRKANIRSRLFLSLERLRSAAHNFNDATPTASLMAKRQELHSVYSRPQGARRGAEVREAAYIAALMGRCAVQATRSTASPSIRRECERPRYRAHRGACKAAVVCADGRALAARGAPHATVPACCSPRNQRHHLLPHAVGSVRIGRIREDRRCYFAMHDRCDAGALRWRDRDAGSGAALAGSKSTVALRRTLVAGFGAMGQSCDGHKVPCRFAKPPMARPLTLTQATEMPRCVSPVPSSTQAATDLRLAAGRFQDDPAEKCSRQWCEDEASRQPGRGSDSGLPLGDRAGMVSQRHQRCT